MKQEQAKKNKRCEKCRQAVLVINEDWLIWKSTHGCVFAPTLWSVLSVNLDLFLKAHVPSLAKPPY